MREKGKARARNKLQLCSVLLPESFSGIALAAMRLAPSAPDDRDSPEAPPRPVSCDPGRINGVML